MSNYHGKFIVLFFLLNIFVLGFRAYAQVGDAYPLDTCLVSGGKLEAMGKSIIYKHQGRELRFCCRDCIPKFQKSPAEYLAKLDAAIIARQTPFYPLDTCLISKQKLGSMGKPFDYVYNNRLVRFCCSGCIDDFLKEPARYMTELNQAVILKQKDKYPLDLCVVTGAKLGSMGNPFDFVHGNLLFRFCCEGCVSDFQKQPARYISFLKKAYERKK